MQRVSFSDMNCSVAQCLEVVGEWWSLLVLRDCFLGVTRFDDFVERLGIARNVLRQRLGTLVDAGVLERVPYCDRPVRHEYRLTQKGWDLWPVIDAMRQWGDRYAAPAGPPIRLRHKGCRHETDPVLVCSECGERVGPRDMQTLLGPGGVEGQLPVRRTGS